MVLDHSPITKIQIGWLADVDHSLTPNELGSLLKNYLLACKVEGKSPLTVDHYYRRIQTFVQFTRAHHLSQYINDLSRGHIRLFLLSLQERSLNPSTVNAYYRTLKTFFNWMVDEGISRKSPMDNIKPPRVPSTKPKPFSHNDIKKLLLLCSGDRFLQGRNRAMVLLFLDTGLRLSELASIQLKDMDFDHETIKVMGKGAKERKVRMGKTVQKALLRYLLMRTDNHICLWVTEERKPLTRDGVQVTIKKLCHRAVITDAKPGPHTFRHTAAINYLRNGGGEFTLQNMLGHATLQMTRRYVSSLGEQDMIQAHRKASPVDNMALK